MLVSSFFMLLLFSSDFFLKMHFFKKLILKKKSAESFFWNTIRVSNGLDPDQDRRSVGPDLCPNCLQRLSAGNKSRASRQS